MYPHFPLTCPAGVLPALRPRGRDTGRPARAKPWRASTRRSASSVISSATKKIVPEPVQRRALASYYGLVTLVDDLVGNMLAVVDNSSLRENTVVLYVSDHGEMAGQHGIWQKQCFYEALGARADDPQNAARRRRAAQRRQRVRWSTCCRHCWTSPD